MIELTCTLVSHTKTKPDSSWAVALVEVAEASGEGLPPEIKPGRKVKAVGARLGLAAPGEGLRLKATWEGGQYGNQLRVEEQSSVGVTNATQAGRWLERLDGVGPRLAQRLLNAFGERVVEVLGAQLGPGEADPLLEVEGIGETTARTIRESWGTLGASGDIEELKYLDGLGLTRFEVNTVLDFSKRVKRMKPQELLAQQPYALVDARGFGFKKTDVVALKAGTPEHAPARIDAAVVYQAETSCDGDTKVVLGQLVRQTTELVGVDGLTVLAAVTRMVSAGRLVMTQDDRGTRWVHPFNLVIAERSIFRLIREGQEAEQAQEDREAAAEGGPTSATPLVQPELPQLEVVAAAAAQAVRREFEKKHPALWSDDEARAALRAQGYSGEVLPWEGP